MRFFLFLELPQRPRTAEGLDKAEFRAAEARLVVGVNFASVTLSRRSGLLHFSLQGFSLLGQLLGGFQHLGRSWKKSFG